MMQDVLMNDYVVNVLSEFIALFLLFVFGWGIYRLTRRRKLLRFFNLSESKRILVYLSHLRVQPGGAIGVDGNPRSFGESALPLSEVSLFPIFSRLFNFVVPGVDNLPGVLRWLVISDVEVILAPSPLKAGDVERQATFIAVGSPAYNIASMHIENAFHPIGVIDINNSSISIPGEKSMTDLRYALVQRVYDQSTQQTAFYVAGMSSLGTYGAAIFLARRWEYLSRRYPGADPFCIVIRVTSDDGRQSEVVMERG